MSSPLYAGIDVSKDWCDVALEAGSRSARFDQILDATGSAVVPVLARVRFDFD